MKRAVIFLNGNRPQRDLVFQTIKTTDTILCANGGSKHALALGVIPNVVIGDQDSLPQSVLKRLTKHNVTLISHPKMKNETDAELAILHAKKEGYTDIVLFGFIGDRFEHMIALLLFLASSAIVFQSVAIIDAKQTMYVVKKRITIAGRKGDVVSLVPLASDAKGVSVRGLLWKLDNATLVFGKTRGVSNEMLSAKASVSVEKGVLLLVHQR